MAELQKTRKSSSRAIRRRLAVVLLALSAPFILLFAVREADVLLGSNLGEVKPHEVYRSGQLTGAGFEQQIKSLGIRSVLNLRGKNKTQWYEEEVAACQRSGVQHFDIAMSARELPTPEVAALLIDVIRTAPRPLLIHCKNGADRTGLASTLLLAMECDVPVSQAISRELTWWHGHMPVGPTQAMNRFFDLYEQTGSGLSIDQWVLTRYPDIYAEDMAVKKPNAASDMDQ